MQVSTELRPMFSYGYGAVATVAILMAAMVVALVVLGRKRRAKPEPQQEMVVPPREDLNTIKHRYLAELQTLTNNFTARKISSRQAYQKLSRLVRNFIFEATNIRVQNYTLAEIEAVGMPALSELVREYYDPEFAVATKGDTLAAVERTREVIERWN